ncbi:MAG: glycosyltransferase family 4 protein [Acidobacteria bacterium]|nr:glycosyltransferase family 4 protein [Acidobacteriota bacterium]
MKPRRTVLFICPVGVRGGAESALFTLWSQLDRWDVEPVAFFLRDGPFVGEARRLGLRVYLNLIPRLLAPYAFVRAVAAIRRCATETNAVAIVSSLGYAHLYGSLAARLADIRSIWWSHALATRSQWLDRIAATLPTDLVITVSERARAAHLSLYPAASTCVIPPGLDLRAWRSAAKVGLTELRRELGVNPGSIVITSVGRLEVGKGQDVLIVAAARVVSRCPGVLILLVGDGPIVNGAGFTKDLRALTAELGLTANVRFLGRREDVAAILGLTDIYVHPARYPESFGLAILEAMACGKPVVTSRVGGPEEILGSSRAGLIVPPNDPSALSYALIELIENSQPRTEMGQLAWDRAEVFSAQGMASVFSREIERVLRESDA